MGRGTSVFGERFASGAGTRAVSLAIFVVVVFLVSLLAGAGTARAGYVPGPTVGPIEPNPALEGNVTISTHYTGTSLLTYPNGTDNATLTAHLDPRVANPIQVVPGGIVSGLLSNDKVAGATTPWNQTSYFGNLAGMAAGSVSTESVVTVNGQSALQWVVNTSFAAAAGAVIASPNIAQANWPSATTTFDWITAEISLTGTCAGCFGTIVLNNQSASYQAVSLLPNGIATYSGNSAGSQWKVLPGQTGFVSFSLAQETGVNLGLNTTGKGATSKINIVPYLNLPKLASTTVTFQLLGLAFGTSAFTLGTETYAKKAITPNGWAGTANLTTLAPTFSYKTISGGGLTLAVQQSATDLPDAAVTITQATIQVANATAGGPAYIEQLDYFFAFGFPIASGLSYGAFKLIDNLTLSGAQYVSVSYGGTSYTTAYQGYASKVVNTVQASVTPTTPATWFGVVDYTGAQWDVISGTPGLFSVGIVQYWWFLLIGAILAIAGASSPWVVREQRGLRIRKGGAVGVLFVPPPRRRATIQANRRANMEGRHIAAVVIGLVFAGAAGIALYSFFISGADVIGAGGAFVAGLILLLALVAIVFIVYEVAHHYRMR